MSINNRLINTGAAGGGNFKNILYTGTALNQETQSVTGLGFQPDFVWIYRTDSGQSDRSANVAIAPTVISYEGRTWYNAIGQDINLDSDGFTLTQANGGSNLAGVGNIYFAFCMKFGGAAVTNTEGNLTSTISANPDFGMSVVKYTGGGTTYPSSSSAYGHGLNQTPEFVMWKWLNPNTASESYTFHNIPEFATNYGAGNLTNANALFDNQQLWGAADSTYIRPRGTVDIANIAHVAVHFHSVDGFSKIGSYLGNGSSVGPTVTTGFEPAWIMIKQRETSTNWICVENKRNTTNPRTKWIRLDDSGYEQEAADFSLDFNSDGFQITGSNTQINRSGYRYFYMVFADEF